VKPLVKTQLRHLGYTVQHLPPVRDDPQLALTVDFEYVVAHYLASRVDPRPFHFLQIGAYDGVAGDPIQAHVHQRGWHGILVEPQPSHFRRLVENYEGVDGLIFINAAVSDRTGTKALYVVADGTGASIDSLGDYSTFRRELLERALRGGVGIQYPGSQIGSIEVACTTFTDVLGEVSYLDLLQIDVEGYDLELLKLFDFDRITPPIVRYEHRLLSAREMDEAVELLAGYGYRMVREKYDTTGYLPLERRSRES
jgi:FkbM family methyltransferase